MAPPTDRAVAAPLYLLLFVSFNMYCVWQRSWHSHLWAQILFVASRKESCCVVTFTVDSRLGLLCSVSSVIFFPSLTIFSAYIKLPLLWHSHLYCVLCLILLYIIFIDTCSARESQHRKEIKFSHNQMRLTFSSHDSFRKTLCWNQFSRLKREHFHYAEYTQRWILY